jgi:hypothetical protein
MLKDIENKILTFANELGGITRTEIVHGTLYIKLERDSDCDYIHREIRNHYREFINPEGGVNMYAVGDEFAFDFVPSDREAPVFVHEDEDQDEEEEDKGIWSEFAEDEILNNIPEEVDTMLDLENDAKEGR